MRDTSTLGSRAEAAVMSALLNAGYDVLIPFNGSRRYDLVIDDGALKKVQCKAGRLKKGVIIFNSASVARTGVRKSYRGQVDYLGVYCPENGKCYLVPVDAVPVNIGRLRVDVTKNGMKKGLTWAVDFEIKSRL